MPAEATTGNSNVKASTDKDRGYAVPKTITPNGTSQLSHTLSWNSHLGLTSDSGPNGATSSVVYSLGVPTQTTSPHGAVTTVSLSATAPHKTTTTNGKWVKETYDGFGRTVKVETGNNTEGVKSVVSTEYAPCACSPLGKLKRTSRPYAGGASPAHWTEYNYDSMGRTVSVVQPAGSGSTTYLYEGNTVTVTDPAGKWKKFEMDGAGNLVKVTEPNPAGGTWDTNYEYNSRGQLKTVLMGVQTRSFGYDANGVLVSATNPENGTVTYTYASGLLLNKQDAKGQKISYDYDTNRRVTAVHRFTNSTTEDPNQLTEYFYDNGGPLTGYPVNGWGRLTGVRYKAYNGSRTFVEGYQYSAGGLTTAKKMQLTMPNPINGASGSGDLEATYGYNNEGQMTSMRYPFGWISAGGGAYTAAGGEQFYLNYNAQGQLRKMGTNANGDNWVSDTTYNVDGSMAVMTAAGYTENRGYNALGQLTSISTPSVSLSYAFPTSTNNGRITSMTISGETVSYAYDALNRLITASSSQGWSETYTYDRYGNLGSIGGQSIGVNQATNRLTQGSYDPNGNYLGGSSDWQYDIENRLVQAKPVSGTGPTEDYGYCVGNKRIWKRSTPGSSAVEHVTLYSKPGRLGTYEVQWQNVGGQYQMRLLQLELNFYYSGRLLRTLVNSNDTGGWIVTDRLGSVVSKNGTVMKYRPYGQDYTSTSDNQLKFGTYFRDAGMGIDYADQRHYLPGVGRFATPDPYRASGGPASPSSWNRYVYVTGDPANFSDPTGLIAGVGSLSLPCAPISDEELYGAGGPDSVGLAFRTLDGFVSNLHYDTGKELFSFTYGLTNSYVSINLRDALDLGDFLGIATGRDWLSQFQESEPWGQEDALKNHCLQLSVSRSFWIGFTAGSATAQQMATALETKTTDPKKKSKWTWLRAAAGIGTIAGGVMAGLSDQAYKHLKCDDVLPRPPVPPVPPPPPPPGSDGRFPGD